MELAVALFAGGGLCVALIWVACLRSELRRHQAREVAYWRERLAERHPPPARTAPAPESEVGGRVERKPPPAADWRDGPTPPGSLRLFEPEEPPSRTA